jgi:uncharacterized membrane protein (UPF0127 family)
MKIRQTIFAAALVMMLAGCRDAGPTSGLRVVPMTIGNRTFKLEVADTLGVQGHGLMQRDSLPDDRGMIFVFEKPEPRNFWMKNVRFPLDIIFMDGNAQVVSIKQMKAYDMRSVPSGKPAQYAIELPLGAAGASGVKVGDTLKLPEGLVKAP